MCEEVFEKVKEPERRYALGMERLKAHDYAGARECFEHDADLGFGDAQYRLAMMYEREWESGHDKKNAEEGFRLMSLAAENGNMYAQMQLGIYYNIGYGVRHDEEKSQDFYKRALKQLRIAAKAGDAEALNALGDYYCVCVVRQDLKKSVEYWKKAAELGDAQGQFNLGCCYKDGYGELEKDVEKARLWLEKAAAQGHDGAKEQLRCLY